MPKERFQPNPNKVEPPRLPPTAPLVPDETQEQTNARLKHTVEAVQAVLKENRAIIVVNNLRLQDGRIIPEIQIQVLK